jgi:hypothetical protein
MVRTQLYLPDNLYSLAKKEAKKNKTTFANVVRISLEKNLINGSNLTIKELRVKFPIFKFAGIVKGAVEDRNLDNDKLDELIYGNP